MPTHDGGLRDGILQVRIRRGVAKDGRHEGNKERLMPFSFRKNLGGSFAILFAPLLVAASVLSFAFAVQPAAAEVACPNQQFRTGAAAQLADCRAYEMVSPVDKNDSDIAILPNVDSLPAGISQAAVTGDKLSYPTYRAFAEAEGAPY